MCDKLPQLESVFIFPNNLIFFNFLFCCVSLTVYSSAMLWVRELLITSILVLHKGAIRNFACILHIHVDFRANWFSTRISVTYVFFGENHITFSLPRKMSGIFFVESSWWKARVVFLFLQPHFCLSGVSVMFLVKILYVTVNAQNGFSVLLMFFLSLHPLPGYSLYMLWL